MFSVALNTHSSGLTALNWLLRRVTRLDTPISRRGNLGHHPVCRIMSFVTVTRHTSSLPPWHRTRSPRLPNPMQSTEFPPLYRTPSLWFEVENLILRAQNTLFRVSKGVLAARPSVFRDMLAFPQSPQMRSPCSEGEMYDGDGEEIIEGYPVVRLHDSAQDVTFFEGDI